jgi:hypothetical protein
MMKDVRHAMVPVIVTGEDASLIEIGWISAVFYAEGCRPLVGICAAL